MTTVTTSIVVEFDSGDTDVNYIFRVEVDSREDGLNNGNTNFKPGDPVYFLIYRTPNTVIDEIIVTHGIVNPSGPVTAQVLDEPIYSQFISTDSVDLTYPVISNFTSEWLGDHGDLGTVQVLDQSKIKLTSVPKESNGLTPKEHYAGVLEYTYTTEFEPYLLQHTPIAGKDKYQIIVYVIGHSI